MLSVFTREWIQTDVAIVDGFVAGLGDYDGNETIDATGRFVVPGFIDAHMHIETSKLLVGEFARLVLPLGTTAVVADPHEIANVLGTDGIHWLADLCDDVPLDVFFMASSCVPASRFESPRRPLTAGDLEGLLHRRRVIGLAEMMNFPGVIAGDEHELEKLRLAEAGHVDGHAPGVLGKALNAYASAGIRSDHEAFTAEEGRERLRAGMWLLIREATAARNLHALLPLVQEFGPGADRLLHGRPRARAHCRRRARERARPGRGRIRDSPDGRARGRLLECGALAPPRPPGRRRTRLPGGPPRTPGSRELHSGPRLEGRSSPPEIPEITVPEWVKHSVRIQPVASNDFQIPWEGGTARVIGLVPGQIVTDSLSDELTVADGSGSRRPQPRPREGGGHRAPSRNRADRPRVRARLWTPERCDRLDVLP